MHSPPRSQPQSPVATTVAYLSPSTAMPRVSFSLRPSLARPLSPPWPLFSGDVWLPTEPSFFSFGFGSKWTKMSLTLWLDRIIDSASALPLLHLRLGDRTAVVVTGIHKSRAVSAECGNASGATAEKQQTKRQIQLEVKAPEDVRRAMVYHTAALSSTLSFYVDTDAERDHILDVMHPTLASRSSLPPLPSPPTRAVTPPPAATPVPCADGAFAKLEMARATHQRGHVVDALAAYAAADKAFAAVDTYVNGAVNEASVLPTQISHARHEIRAAIDALEKEKAQPRAAVAVSTTTVDMSEPLSAPPKKSLGARLLGLQTFAHSRDVDRAQREHRVSSDDLTLRFHALRNEKPTAPTTESLQQRLDRLRGPPSSPSARTASTLATTQKLSPVEQIIQQAMDEVALGIVDDDVDEEENASCSTRSSDSDSDHEPYHRGHRRRPHP